MKQSDILSFAINGVQRDIADAREHVMVLEKVLQELKNLDNEYNTKPVAENNIGRPAEFVPEPIINHNRFER